MGAGRCCAACAAGLRPVDGARGEGRDLDRPALDRRADDGAGSGARRAFTDAAGQGEHFAVVQDRIRRHRVVARQFGGRDADARRDAGNRVAAPRHGDLIAGIRDHAARIGRRAVRGGGTCRLGGRIGARTVGSQIPVERAGIVAGGQHAKRRAKGQKADRCRTGHALPRSFVRVGPGTVSLQTVSFKTVPFIRGPAPRPAARSAPAAIRHSHSPSRFASP